MTLEAISTKKNVRLLEYYTDSDDAGAGGAAKPSKKQYEYKKILEDEARIVAEVKDQPRRLEYLHGIVKDFFVDWHKFKGNSVKHAMGAVDEVLKDYSLERLVEVVERGG